jgi:hypothetical protein
LLQGPSSGTVHLPTHLDWSGNAVYDLDAAVLRRLWALLWLPAQLRNSWEQKFPALAEISRVTATA